MSERIFNLHDFILFAIVLECILLAAFQAAQPHNTKQSKCFLAAFLAAMAISSAGILLLWNTEIQLPAWVDQHLLPYVVVGSLIARGPSLYLYACSITAANFCWRTKPSWHLACIPAALLYLVLFSVSSSELRMESTVATIQFRNNLLWDAIVYISLLYAGATIYRLQRYKRLLKESYSIYSTFEANWLTTLAVGFFISWGWGTLTHILGQHTDIDRSIADTMGITINYLTFLLINTLFIYSLLFSHKLLPAHTEEKKRKSESGVPTETAIKAVTTAINDDKIFLAKNINIEQLAKHVDLPVKTVSQVINRHFATSFFELINSHRIETAKTMLSDPNYQDKTILDILFEAGFNSTSSFHRQFKRYTNQSPSEYRQKQKAL